MRRTRVISGIPVVVDDALPPDVILFRNDKIGMQHAFRLRYGTSDVQEISINALANEILDNARAVLRSTAELRKEAADLLRIARHLEPMHIPALGYRTSHKVVRSVRLRRLSKACDRMDKILKQEKT